MNTWIGVMRASPIIIAVAGGLAAVVYHYYVKRDKRD